MSRRDQLSRFFVRWRYVWPYLVMIAAFTFTQGLQAHTNHEQQVANCRDRVVDRDVLRALLNRSTGAQLEIPPDASPDLRRVMEAARQASADLRRDAERIVADPECVRILHLDE